MDPHYPFVPDGVPDSELELDVSDTELSRINEAFTDRENIGDDMIYYI